jgi:hypothetical protein
LELSADRKVINSEQDWKDLGRDGLDTILDPLVFRAADVFLAGGERLDGTKAEQRWSAVRSSIGSLCTFFDSIILEEQLPIFDYNITFPGDIYPGQMDLIERCEGALVPVNVQDQAYQTVKNAAIERMSTFEPCDERLASTIANEMTAFDWEWRPDIWPDGHWHGENSVPERSRLVETYQFSGLLFSGYAQSVGGRHVIQPGRSSLYVKTCLRSWQHDLESELFSELTERIRATQATRLDYDLPEAPTFLPLLLLARPKDRMSLLKSALELRENPAVKDYRAWRLDGFAELDMGLVPTRHKEELERLADRIVGEVVPNAPADEFKGSISIKLFDVVEGKVEGPIRAPTEKLLEAFGWILDFLPRRRYRKLLQRMVLSERRYADFGRQLEQLWR